MKIVKLTDEHVPLLKKFCRKCAKAGFQNNSSLELLKWGGHVDLKEPPHFWALLVNDEIASISGSHYFGDHAPGIRQIRCLFRSATLPKYSNLIPGISKNHMNSIPFSLLMPHQLLHSFEQGDHIFYITTSNDHDASGKMARTHRALYLLSKRRIVDFESEEIIYSTPQIKWRLILPLYYQALMAFKPVKHKLGIEDDINYPKLKRYMSKYDWGL